MSDVSQRSAATDEPLATDAASQLVKANKYAFSLWVGSQNVLLDEMMFAGTEILVRAVEETRILQRISRQAGRGSFMSRTSGRSTRSAPGISWTSSVAIPNGY